MTGRLRRACGKHRARGAHTHTGVRIGQQVGCTRKATRRHERVHRSQARLGMGRGKLLGHAVDRGGIAGLGEREKSVSRSSVGELAQLGPRLSPGLRHLAKACQRRDFDRYVGLARRLVDGFEDVAVADGRATHGEHAIARQPFPHGPEQRPLPDGTRFGIASHLQEQCARFDGRCAALVFGDGDDLATTADLG